MKKDDEKIIIALDCMGGDHAPGIVIEGAAKTLKKNKNVYFLIFGDETKIAKYLDKHSNLKKNATINHTENFISAEEKPSIALRKSKNTSMRLAIEAVKEHKAHSCVSAGNTGALMAISKLVLRTLPGIDRPAIASVFPTKTDRCIFTDLGANIDCNSDNLVQFAIMGDAFAKVILNLESPRIALLNVGSEETKGSGVVKSAAEDLKDGEYSLNFQGYIESDKISEGAADVIVTDGFTGNIALKMAEGTVRLCGAYIKRSFRRSPIAMLGGILAKCALKKTFKQLDPRLHNGAMFLGLNGIVVKSHGGTDALGFSNAINVSYELAKSKINEKICRELSIYEDLEYQHNSNYDTESNFE